MSDIGIEDFQNRQIVYTFDFKADAADSRLVILMHKNGNLSLMRLNNIRVTTTVSRDTKKIKYIFVGQELGGFTFKGGGKIYGCTDQNSYPCFKMDYTDGNLFTTQLNKYSYNIGKQYVTGVKKAGPLLFLSSIWIMVIKRQQKKQRELYKSNLLKRSNE
jgi:hypothetical protein